jgi:hypothetical protein
MTLVIPSPSFSPHADFPLAKHADANDTEDTKCRRVTEEVDSSWTSPAVLVQKKDESFWFFMDYRRLNVTTKGCFLLPRINNTLDTLAGAKWFSTFDLKNG